MSDLPSKLTGSIAPTPEQSQEQFRAFLRRVADDVFDGNVKRMAQAVYESVGYDWDEGGDNFRRKLGRIMRGPNSDTSHGTDRVDPNVVEWTWKYLSRSTAWTPSTTHPTSWAAASCRSCFSPQSL